MIYGYDSRSINEYGLKQMREISIAATPNALREMAQFLQEVAEQLENSAGSSHWHKHAPSAMQKALECDVVILRNKPDEGMGSDWR